MIFEENIICNMNIQFHGAYFFLFAVLVFYGYQVQQSQAVKVRFIDKPDSDFITTNSSSTNTRSKRLLYEYTPHKSNYTVGLRGNVDLGYFYATLFVGYPPQLQTVIIDSGSSVTAVPCTGIEIIS